MSKCELHGLHVGEVCPTCARQFDKQVKAILIVGLGLGFLYWLLHR